MAAVAGVAGVDDEAAEREREAHDETHTDDETHGSLVKIAEPETGASDDAVDGGETKREKGVSGTELKVVRPGAITHSDSNRRSSRRKSSSSQQEKQEKQEKLTTVCFQLNMFNFFLAAGGQFTISQWHFESVRYTFPLLLFSSFLPLSTGCERVFLCSLFLTPLQLA